MSGWWGIIDDAISKAMEQGAFDNLAGSGQPLNLYNNPHEDPTMRSANRIMQQHGIAPDWIMEHQSLTQATEKARTELQQAWVRYQTGGASAFAKSQWATATDQFRQAVVGLNQRILTFNLKAPDTSVHLAPLIFERELERIKNGNAG